MLKNIDLIQAVSARLCHDLAGTVGTIHNCLGLMENSNKSISLKAKNLVTHEANSLVHKIRFFRSAYGAAQGEDEMSLVFMAKLIKDFFEDSSVKLNIQFDKGLIFLESNLAKALMCITVITSEKINHLGAINLHITASNNLDGYNIKLTAQAGKKLLAKDEISSILDGLDTSSINVENCREYYIDSLCQSTNYALAINKADNILEYNLSKKI